MSSKSQITDPREATNDIKTIIEDTRKIDSVDIAIVSDILDGFEEAVATDPTVRILM